MKKISCMLFVIIHCVLIHGPGVAAEFYVDAFKGDDKNGDGSLERPWRTLQHAAETMNEEDVCLIREGIYRETVRPKDSQIFQAYEDEYVLITGCDRINGWIKKDVDIRKVSFEKGVKAVFINGTHMQKARWPDEDGDPLSKNEWANSYAKNITFLGGDTAAVTFRTPLPEKNWIGAYYVGLNGHNYYNCNIGKVIKMQGNKLMLTKLSSQLRRGFFGLEGLGQGYLIHHLSALDAPGEWHWQNDTLYLYPPEGIDLANEVVEVQTRLWGFDLSGCDHVILKGINFKAASVLTGGDGMEGSTGHTIDGCTFRYHAPFGLHYYAQYYHSNGSGAEYYAAGGPVDGTSGITVSGSNHVINNCYIGHAWGGGIRLLGNDNRVENCLIEDVNWMTRFQMKAIRLAGRGHVVTRNTIQHVPGSGIHAVELDIRDVNNTVKEPTISYNLVRDYGYLLRDSETAGIYSSNLNA